MFDKLKAQLLQENKTIVLPEGPDIRILEAASRLTAEKILNVVLCGNKDEIEANAKQGGFDISACTIIDPENYEGMDEMVEKMVELRKGKMTAEQCRANLQKSNYFGTMLVKMGKADCLLGGATYTTADTVRPALQLIKTKPGNKSVCACFILFRPGNDNLDRIAIGDSGLIIHPTVDELVEIAGETAKCAQQFGIDPKVAFLSFSTKGSAKDSTVDMMVEACEKAKVAYPQFPMDGELQFDAAVVPSVGQKKAPGSPVAGYANTFIVPDLNTGNICYKVAQRLGGYEAYGPILLGLNAPINDLSRGCTAEEVYKMAMVTAVLV